MQERSGQLPCRLGRAGLMVGVDDAEYYLVRAGCQVLVGPLGKLERKVTLQESWAD